MNQARAGASGRRRITASLITTLIVAMCVSPWVARPALANAPEGVIDSLGTPLVPSSFDIRAAAAGSWPDGRTVLYATSPGSPAVLNAIDAVSGRLLAQPPLTGQSSTYYTAVAPDGTVYAATQSPGARLFSYVPGDAHATDLGAPLPGQSFVGRPAVGPTGIAYAGLYPSGKLVSYDPSSSSFADLGTIAAGETYLRAIATDGANHLYIGTGPNARLVRYSTATATTTTIALPSPYDSGQTFVNEVYYRDGLVFALVTPAQAWLVYDTTTSTWVATISGATASSISPVIDGDVYLTRSGTNTMWRFDVATHAATVTSVPTGTYAYNDVRALAALELDGVGWPDDSLVAIGTDGTLQHFNPTTEEYREVANPGAGGAYTITELGTDAAGDVAAVSADWPGGVAIIDPVAEATDIRPGVGEARFVGNVPVPDSSALFFGTTGDAGLWRHAPGATWEPPTSPARVLSQTANGQTAVVTAATASQRIVVGSIATGAAGGLSIYDSRTDAVRWEGAPVAGHGVTALATIGTTTVGGTSTVDSGTTGDARLFTFDLRNHVTTWSGVLAAGITEIHDLVPRPDGTVWGLADDSTIFSFNPVTKAIGPQVDLFGDGRDAGTLGEPSLKPYGPHHLIASAAGEIFLVDVVTREVQSLGDGAYGTAAADGTIVFADGAELLRFTPAAAPTPATPPSLTVQELGDAMESPNVRSIAYDELSDGTPVGYVTSGGVPATFSVIDLETGDQLFSSPLPGYQVVGSTEIAADGTVYFYAMDPTPGAAFRYHPDTETLEHLGDSIASQNWVRDFSAAADGTVYMSTFPDAKLVRHDPATDTFTDFGRVTPDTGATYGQSVEVISPTEVWVGTGPEPHLVSIDTTTGVKTEIPYPGGWPTGVDYIAAIQKLGDKVYVNTTPLSTDQVFAYDLTTSSWETTRLDDVMGAGITEPDASGDRYFLRIADGTGERQLHALEAATMTETPTAFGSTDIPDEIRWAGTVYDIQVVELDLPAFPGDTVVGITATGQLWRYNLTNEDGDVITADVEPSAVDLVGFSPGPDGRIYTGAKIGAGFMSIIDDETHVITQVTGPSQAEGVGGVGDFIVVGTYTGADIFVGDLSEPWSWGTNPVDVNLVAPQPIELGREGPYYQDRIWDVEAAGDLVAMGTIPKGGVNGGLLVVLDPDTLEADIFEDVVEDQSILSLAYRDGLLYGATSIYGGTGTPATATEAKLFIWDVAAEEKVWEGTIVANAVNLTSLTWGPDDMLWGISENGYVWEFDPDERVVTRYQQILPPSELITHRWGHHTSIVWDPVSDGFIGTMGWKMFWLDDDTLSTGFYRSGSDTYRVVQGGNGDVFCVGTSDVCVIDRTP